MTDAAIMAPHGFVPRCTGGNCVAWAKTNAAGNEVLICSEGNTIGDDPAAHEWICGVFDGEGDEIDAIDTPTTLHEVLRQARAAGHLA